MTASSDDLVTRLKEAARATRTGNVVTIRALLNDWLRPSDLDEAAATITALEADKAALVADLVETIHAAFQGHGVAIRPSKRTILRWLRLQ